MIWHRVAVTMKGTSYQGSGHGKGIGLHEEWGAGIQWAGILRDSIHQARDNSLGGFGSIWKAL
jgi:hypothetical protein